MTEYRSKSEMRRIERMKAFAHAMKEIVWRCGDCGNIYTSNVQHCPNTVLDNLVVQKVLTVKDLE